MPLQRRVPKRGFDNPTRARVANVDVGALNTFADGTDVTLEMMKANGLIKGRFDRVKVLGSRSLDKKLTVHAHGFSRGAAAKIEAAGGTAVVVEIAEPAPKVSAKKPEATED